MVFQAFLVALVAFFAYSSNKFLGDAMVNRPLVTATLTGLVLGDLQTGLIMAGTLELTWMGRCLFFLIYCAAGEERGRIQRRWRVCEQKKRE